MKNIVIVTHKFLTQPDDDLVLFLNESRFSNVLHILHSFSDAPDRCSSYIWYKESHIHRMSRTQDYAHWPEVLVYLKELYFTLSWIMKTNVNWDKYIGMDGLCVFYGRFLRTLRKVRKVVYWAMDFVPEQRFESEMKNKIYHWVNIRGYTTSDEMWDLSPRMAEAREKYLGITVNDYRSHKVVPYGVWVDRIRKYSHHECETTTLVFMGHLLKKQGVQLVIRAIPEILKQIPDFKFKIIGTGSYLKELIKTAEELRVLSYCDFKGKINSHKELEDEIARSCIAIAPYIKELDTWTYYADPGKVKTYLACGVPVLLTEVPWNAEEIEKAGCGKIISEAEDNFVSKIAELMDKNVNQEYRDRAIEYSDRFNYKNIFSTLRL